MVDVKTRRFRHFWPFSLAIAHCFGIRARFRWPVTPGTQLFGRRQNSSFRAFLAVFVGYNTLFWGPGTVLMALDPRYIAIWTSSKLVVLSISGRFVGYNTLFWGSEDDFDGPWPPVDGYFDVVHARRFEHFLSFSWAITPCFVVRGRFRWSVILGRRLLMP